MKNGSITKKILRGLLITGAIYIAASSPYFVLNLSRNLLQVLKKRNFLKAKDSQFNNTFYYLKRRGYLDIYKKNHQTYIALTSEGKKKAGKYLIDDLLLKKPKNWDRKYRIVIFDIPNTTRIKRDAFRGKLKELGFFRLQQSVWVHAFDCKKEIKLLQDFFGLTSKEIILIEGFIPHDKFLRQFFKLS